MFDSHQKSTGRDYSLTAALLAFGIMLVPALLLANHSVSRMALILSSIGSLVCLCVAWLNWRRNSKLTIPTIEDERTIAK